MAHVHLLCGKIASGKSYYAKKLMAEQDMVLISMDDCVEEMGLDYFKDDHNAMIPGLQMYLIQKAGEIAKCGTDVILDFGFWSKEQRSAVTAHLKSMDAPYLWHYMDVSKSTWSLNIEERNAGAVQAGYSQFLIDEKRIDEINAEFDIPTRDEIDVWVYVHRD